LTRLEILNSTSNNSTSNSNTTNNSTGNNSTGASNRTSNNSTSNNSTSNSNTTNNSTGNNSTGASNRTSNNSTSNNSTSNSNTANNSNGLTAFNGTAISKESNVETNFRSAYGSVNAANINNVAIENALGDIANLEIIKKHPLQDLTCFTIYIAMPNKHVTIDKSRLYVLFESTTRSEPLKGCLNDFYNAEGILKDDNVFYQLKRNLENLTCVEIHPLIAFYFYIKKTKHDRSYSLVLSQIINPAILNYLDRKLSNYDHRVKDQYAYAFFKMCEMGNFNMAKLTSETEIVAKVRDFFEKNPEYTVCERNLKTIQTRPRLSAAKFRCLIAEFASPLITKRGDKLKNVFVGGKRKTRRQIVRRRKATRKSRY
jgi:hypothetical protein